MAYKRKRRAKVRWEKVDWSLPVDDLQRRLKVTRTRILQMRREAGYRMRTSPPIGSARWQSVDWTEQDTTIALQLGVTRERVRQKRKALQMPDSPFKYDSAQRRALRKWMLENQEAASILTAPKIAKALNYAVVSLPMIRGLKRELGIKHTLERKFPKQLVNWELPNRVLSYIWKVHMQLVAGLRWKMHKPARWDFRTTPPCIDDPAFQEAVQAEGQKAREWRLARAQKLKKVRALYGHGSIELKPAEMACTTGERPAGDGRASSLHSYSH